MFPVPKSSRRRAGEPLDVLEFGARGDGRTDDTESINRALLAARDEGGGTVVLPPRRYLIGGSPRLDGTGLRLEGAANVWLYGPGATLLQGPAGLRTLAVVGSSRVRITGLTLVGNTAHAGERYFEHSAGIAVVHGSRSVLVEDCYVTNYLGDCLYLGGTLSDGGGTGQPVRNVEVRNCLLKERYGDGERIHRGGSRSRLAVAVIDAIGVRLRHNEIYGTVDFEPNLDGQHTVSCLVERNQFLAGPVTPQREIGQAWHHDEPLADPAADGAVAIQGGVSFTGVPGEPIVRGNVVRQNSFDLGVVSVQNPYVAHIVDNTFERGQILVGARAGPNYTVGVRVKDNRAERVLPGERCFVKLAGRVASCEFVGNVLDDAGGAVIGDDGADSGDLGRCVFRDNANTARDHGAGLEALATSPARTSVVRPADQE